MMKMYAYIQLSHWDMGIFRLLGPGLGNLLFPWSRAVVASQQYSLKLIWPTWPQFKIGPIIRREPDLRFYSNLFENPGNYLDGFKKLRLLATSRRLSESSLNEDMAVPSGMCPEMIRFCGMKNMFEPIRDHRELIKNELLRMTRYEHKRGMEHDFQRSITVHIRMGDFDSFDDQRMRGGDSNVRLSLAWVTRTIQALRESLGACWPVWIFSDGRDEELKQLFQLPDVHRLSFGSSLADMLAMSRSNVLIVSSTFSMWSSFLGSVPSIYYPGQLRGRLHGSQIEHELGTNFRESFISELYKVAETLE